MTTDSRTSRGLGSRPLVVAVLVTALLGAALAVVGSLVSGRSAAGGALVGTAVAVAVFATGMVVVDAVSRRVPALSLLVALTTYTLQVVAMAVVFAVLDGSAALESDLDRQWLGSAVVVAVAAWLAVQVPLTLRRRIPVYDLARQGDE